MDTLINSGALGYLGDLLRNETFQLVFHYIYLLAPIWLPILLGGLFWQLWVTYIRADFISKQETILLEIKLPLEISKSPLAMELVLTGLYQTSGESTPYDKFWHGKVRPWFSLELVSIEGQIKFYIWTRKFWKNIVESELYAQYPGIEIYEAKDYTLPITYNKETMSMWGCRFRKTQPDVYPIKTYVDYGLDKEPKEEFKVDPISPVLELLGTLGKGQQLWIQILVRSHRKERKKPGSWFGKVDWREQTKGEIKKVIAEAQKRVGAKEPSFFNVTPGQSDAVKAMERNAAKLPFDVGMRGLYFAKKENFNAINIVGLIGSVRQYSSNNLNSIALTGETDFDYPWQDYKDKRKDRLKRMFLDAYKRRSYFHAPYKYPPFVMSNEELATIFHFPGSAVQTPTFERIVSKKSEAPSNLPI